MDVQTGEVKFLDTAGELFAPAIGSCVALLLFDENESRLGLAHIMLPGASRGEKKNLRYMEDAFESLVEGLKNRGTKVCNLSACAAGGANVIRDPTDRICADNIRSLQQTLAKYGIPLVASSLYGDQRRCLRVKLFPLLIQVSLGEGDLLDLYS